MGQALTCGECELETVESSVLAEVESRILAATRILSRDELNLREILDAIYGFLPADPMFHDWDGHNTCTRCGQRASNTGASDPCPKYPLELADLARAVESA